MEPHGQSPWYLALRLASGRHPEFRFIHGQRPWSSRMRDQAERFLRAGLGYGWHPDVVDRDGNSKPSPARQQGFSQTCCRVINNKKPPGGWGERRQILMEGQMMGRLHTAGIKGPGLRPHGGHSTSPTVSMCWSVLFFQCGRSVEIRLIKTAQLGQVHSGLFSFGHSRSA